MKGNAYYDFFPTLAASGIEVRAFDQRYVYTPHLPHLLNLPELFNGSKSKKMKEKSHILNMSLK